MPGKAIYYRHDSRSIRGFQQLQRPEIPLYVAHTHIHAKSKSIAACVGCVCCLSARAWKKKKEREDFSAYPRGAVHFPPRPRDLPSMSSSGIRSPVSFSPGPPAPQSVFTGVLKGPESLCCGLTFIISTATLKRRRWSRLLCRATLFGMKNVKWIRSVNSTVGR